MNEQNYEYLRNQMFYTGFGHNLQDPLLDKLSKGKQEFQLHYDTQIDSCAVRAELQFSKSKQSEMYFFNSYRIEVLPKGENSPMSQNFTIRGNDRFTLKEAFNLMAGRSVHKEFTNAQGIPYQAWFQLDFKELDLRGNARLQQYHKNYGYDLESQLERLPIIELRDEGSRKKLLASLKRGNRQAVMLDTSGGQEKLFIEAVPRFKALCMYNEQGVRTEFAGDLSKSKGPSAKQQEQQRQIQVHNGARGRGI